MEIADIADVLSRAWVDYWQAAVGPLHRLTWQTFVLCVFIILLFALLITALLHYSWVFSRPAIRGVTVNATPHSHASCLRLSVEDHLRFHKVVTQAKSEIAKDVRAQDQRRYYVVSIVQTKPVRELVYREMKLHAPVGGLAYLPPGVIQLDARDHLDVRRRNSFDADNDPEAPIEGTYDVYIRPVRWYDVRHWLMHPNREVRILIWVTLITTTLPVLLDLLFG